MITIDKNVPLARNHPGRRAKYPFGDMSLGDSFLYPPGTERNAANSAASSAAKRLSMKFTVRMTDEGLRCWRVE